MILVLDRKTNGLHAVVRQNQLFSLGTPGGVKIKYAKMDVCDGRICRQVSMGVWSHLRH